MNFSYDISASWSRRCTNGTMEVIEKIPALLRSIDFSDNRLTDKTLIPFTNKLSHLTYLDLSYDKI